jgi:uncharacterized protein
MGQFGQLISIHCAGSSVPFPDEWAYDAHALSLDKLGAIHVPFLAFNADDDPIVSWIPCDYDHNSWVTIVITCGGEHLGRFQSSGTAHREARRPALEWLKATAEDVSLGHRSVRPAAWSL